MKNGSQTTESCLEFMGNRVKAGGADLSSHRGPSTIHLGPRKGFFTGTWKSRASGSGRKSFDQNFGQGWMLSPLEETVEKSWRKKPFELQR